MSMKTIRFFSLLLLSLVFLLLPSQSYAQQMPFLLTAGGSAAQPMPQAQQMPSMNPQGLYQSQQPQQQPNTISIQNYQYSPAQMTVGVGTTVTWINKDSVSHTATSDNGPAQFDSGTIATNQSYSYTFTMPGTYTYHCTIHPNMKATITVTGQGNQQPPNSYNPGQPNMGYQYSYPIMQYSYSYMTYPYYLTYYPYVYYYPVSYYPTTMYYPMSSYSDGCQCDGNSYQYQSPSQYSAPTSGYGQQPYQTTGNNTIRWY